MMSSRVSHFTSLEMEGLIEEAGMQHLFTTAYSLWANGTVEHLCQRDDPGVQGACIRMETGS